MIKPFQDTVLGRGWSIIWTEVTRVDRVWYYILLFFMLLVPILLYSYGRYWFTTSLAGHIAIVHQGVSNECGFAWARFLPLLLLGFCEIAVLIIFAAYAPQMLRNFLNPEYEALDLFKKAFDKGR